MTLAFWMNAALSGFSLASQLLQVGRARNAPKGCAGFTVGVVPPQKETCPFDCPVVTQGTVTLRRFSLPNRPAFTN